MTAPRREPGMDEDQGQARTRGAWMLKPNAFGAMTANLDVPAQRRRKPSGYDGLPNPDTCKMANQTETQQYDDEP